MTVTDVRISYKLETGEYPMYIKPPSYKNHGEGIVVKDPRRPQNKTKFKLKKNDLLDFSGNYTLTPHGTPRCSYGKWLEDKLGNSHRLQEQYFVETRLYPSRNLFGDYSRREAYAVDYIYWLENLYLAKHK